jgi:hypothetical protein
MVPEVMSGEEYYTQQSEKNGVVLSDRAILVRIKECMNGVFKYDTEAQKNLAQAAGGDEKSFVVTKKLYPKFALSDMETCISQARHIHRTMTLPWNDVGYRLLPNTKFFDFVNAVNKVKEKFVQAREYFKENLDLYKQEGMTRLGIYAGDFYPKNVDDIDKLFQLEIMIRPVPNTNDIRVEVPQEILDEIRKESNTALYEDTAMAVKDVWSRFNKVLTHMHSKLSKDDPKKFRSSMIKNIENMISMVPQYNLVDDEELNKITDEAKVIVDNIKGIDDLKEDESLRKDTVDKLTILLDKFPQL